MVFGADKIPGIAKGLGKGHATTKGCNRDIKKEIQKSAKEARYMILVFTEDKRTSP